jgi:glycine amidinotransferase
MPRDIFMVVGDTIIEAPMAWRSRYFESLSYRGLMNEYFEHGAKWLTAPKSIMDQGFFNADYDPDVPYNAEGVKQFVISERDVAFDAADFVRLGTDILVQKSNVTNGKGIEWVRRHLGEEFTVHEVEFGDAHPMHIDTTIVPLCPGKLLINPTWVNQDNLPKLFKDWEIIEAPAPVVTNDSALFFSSDWLTVNFISLDEKTVIVEENEIPLIKLLEQKGFEVITIPFRNFYQFGGSTHCATADIRRRGELKSYT